MEMKEICHWGRAFLKVLGSLFFILLFAGARCSQELPEGEYQGNLLEWTPHGYVPQPVLIQILRSDKKVTVQVIGELKGTDPNSKKNENKLNAKYIGGPALFVFNLTLTSQDEIHLESPDWIQEKFALKRKNVGDTPEKYQCFSDEVNWNVELCHTHKRFYLKFIDQNQRTQLVLSGHKFKPEPVYPLETPVHLSLPDAIHKALTHSYSSFIAMEQLIQAKQAALAAWLNLVPHLTTNLIWSVDPSFVSYIGSAQILVPFLLPNYWIDAVIASIDKKIKLDAYLIFQSDLAVSVEQLFYAFERDTKILAAFQSIQDDLEFYEQTAFDSDLEGSATQVFLNEIAALRAFLKASQDEVEAVLKQDRTVLSKILGFNNPEAVQSISFGEEISPYDKSEPLHWPQLGDWAIQRSFELQQMDYLIDIAELKEVSLFFNWVDPSGDPKIGLGVNLIGQVKVSQSQISVLELERAELRRTIQYDAKSVVDEFNDSRAELRKPQRNAVGLSNIESMDYHFLLEQSIATGEFRFERIQKSVQALLASVVERENNLAIYRTARSKKDRFLLTGYYEYLLLKLPEFRTGCGDAGCAPVNPPPAE